MRRKLKIKGQVYAAVCLFLLLLGGPRMWADLAGAGSAPLELTRIEGKIVLDGMSTEAAWDGVSYHSLTGLLPNAGQTPRHPTDILVAYDDEFLYVAGRLYDDEPEKIQANSRKRDSEDGSSEWFGVVIDSFNDKENGLAFFTTPAGLRWDAAVRNDCRSLCLNTDWNAPWDVAVARNSQGWFAEMRIPLSCLKFQEIDGKVTMGLISWRRHARTNAYTIFPDIPPKWFTRSRWKVSRAREIVLTGIKSKRPLYIAPYLLGGLNQTPVLNSEGTAYETQNDSTFEAGLDIKYGLSNNLTLDVTVNTDFAQVEADDQQLNLTRYSLFFPEKRLFFQERSANFDFCFDDTNRLFYSRRLGIRDGQQVRILGGVRMVGRVGAWDIGVRGMQTA
ncbi:MAG: carbohydrate binding family 9 domain-containing protein [bacterium]|nr:carbohydrate binding family 9 domain-containing protein [bacterium]